MAADGLITLPSNYEPKETMDRLEAEIRARGMVVFARVDHAAGAAQVGLSLRPTEVLIFGNAKAGTPLMQAEQTIGIDLPLKALVWQDANGKVWLSYNAPLAPAQCGQAESLLFGRILNRLPCLRLRLGPRFDGRFGRTRSTTVQMAPGRSVLRRRVRWRVCQAANNAFDSVATGTSREQRCKNENCSDAHHD